MSTDDPFAELGSTGRTFVMPTPGQRPAAARANPGADVAADLDAPAQSGLNPLVALANPLLALVPQIRATTHLAQPATLRESLAQALREFESRARAQGIAPERILAARYVLCTLLDESATGTPWGGSGQWGRHSLLTLFHNEAVGGEKVFQLMAKLAQAPKDNLDLLELIYAALTLGFEGRYRADPGGTATLESIRARLAQIIRTERGDYPKALAQHWQGVAPKRHGLMLGWLPLWVTTALAALFVVGTFMLLSFRLGEQSDPVYARIQGLRLPSPLEPPKPAAVVAAAPRLAKLLAPEIQAGAVAVVDRVDRSIVTMPGDGLFAPGSATLAPERERLVLRIAAALSGVAPGPVMVAGHTDNQPIRSARFPSNWHLSQERADSVRQMLVAAGVPAQRVRAEGRADAEPIAANDTPARRAANRRVEITLYTATPKAVGAK